MPSRHGTQTETKREEPREQSHVQPPGRQGRRQAVAIAWSRRPLRVSALVCLLAIVLAGAGAIVARMRTQANVAATTPQLIERLDAHVDDLANAPDLEMDIALSQTIDACGVPLHGQFCLRYSIAQDDVPVQAGYGVIPASQVRVDGSEITLVTNTAHDPGFTHLTGSGGMIAITWTALGNLPRVAAHAVAMRGTTARGSIIGMALPSTNVTAAVVIHGGA